MFKTFKAIGATMLAILFSSYALGNDLRVGVDPNLKPFVYVDSQGEYHGFDVDAAKDICSQLQRKCKFVPIDWDGLIPSLMVGKIDVIISSMSITEEREKVVDFTDVFYKSPSQLLVMNHSDDLKKGDTVGVLRGSTDESYVKETYPDVKVYSYANQNEAFLDLKSGRIVALLSPRIEANAAIEDMPEMKGYSFVGEMIDDPKYYGPGIGFAVKQGNVSLRNDLNESIANIRSSESWDEKSNQYFSFNIFKTNDVSQ
jgi:arginine/ornithine transport system substrate-binding protein